VLEAIGTDAEYLAWVRTQPCAVTGKFDYTKDEATGETRMACEASHVDRINLGRGIGHKPLYAAIPLVHVWHMRRHDEGAMVFASDGKNTLEGMAWEDKQRAKYVTEWASSKLAATLGVESMGYVDPPRLRLWAKQHDLTSALPRVYRETETNGGTDGPTR